MNRFHNLIFPRYFLPTNKPSKQSYLRLILLLREQFVALQRNANKILTFGQLCMIVTVRKMTPD